MKVLLVGDSHTAVTFPLLRTALKEAGHSVVGMVSKAGWGVSSFNQEPSELANALQASPEAVIVSLGGNNHTLNSSAYKGQIEAFLQGIGHPKTKVIWISPATATRPDVQDRHQWTSDWLDANLPPSVIFIDARPHTRSGHRADGVHFTQAGYRAWVNGIKDDVIWGLRLPIMLYKTKQSLGWIALILALGGLGWALWDRRSR